MSKEEQIKQCDTKAHAPICSVQTQMRITPNIWGPDELKFLQTKATFSTQNTTTEND